MWREIASDGDGGERLLSRGYVFVDEDGRRLRHDESDFFGEHVEVIGVAGESHHMEELQSAGFGPGQMLQLVPDPSNPYDKNAIEIRDQSGLLCGYVPRGDAKRVGALLKKGVDLRAMAFFETLRQDGTRCSLKVLLAPGLDGSMIEVVE